MTTLLTALEPARADRATAIRGANDTLRRTGQGGRVMVTAGIAALPAATQAAVLAAVRAFDDFDADNDPYGEHDFGAVEVAKHRLVWKIDAYDRDLQFASPDPSDPAVTRRVLTIMLASEY